ncbi:galanin receptor 2b-like [Xenia sp. Carnegie-2017]|uniref:galanin receptor 2b-like n=1 Tax=Xenia sp. Carnegie-2017 TaxID=2897299 RepID=UPI001F034C4D|nr:galanin receptor 2b-like [Xenia sp. Carnegie-2017]
MLVKFQLSMIWTTIEASLMSLVFLSIERVIAVCYPLTCKIIVSVKRTIVTLCVIWIFAFSCGVFITLDVFKTQFALTIVFEVLFLIYLSGQNDEHATGLWVGYKKHYAQFYVCVFIEVSATNSIIIHFYVLWALRRGAKQRFQMTEDPQQSQAFLKENVAHKKVTTVVTILLVVLIITCAPYLVCTQMLIVNFTFDKTLHQKVNVHIFSIIYDYSVAFMYINFLCNSIIYAWRLRMYRKAFFSLVGRSISL